MLGVLETQEPTLTMAWQGRILTPPPERRIHPADRRTALGLPDESGVPIGVAARLGGGVRMRPLGNKGKQTFLRNLSSDH
jgi:hypothetical protein